VKRVASDGAALCCLVRNLLRRRHAGPLPAVTAGSVSVDEEAPAGAATDFFMPAASAGEAENVDA